MRVLVACEESQAVCIAFRERGHEAYSCDIEPCSGGHPEWHIQYDVLKIIHRTEFLTQDNVLHIISGWDMMIAFPPCTHLAVSGARWFKEKRADGRQQKSLQFVACLMNADIPKIGIENPIGVIPSYIFHYVGNDLELYDKWVVAPFRLSDGGRKPDQIIHPWMFGHGETKATCLWLKNLPKLQPTNIVEGREGRIWKMTPSPERAKLRSKTFPGIAKAMAEQWG